MEESEELAFIKSLYPETHKLLMIKVAEERVAIQVERKSNGLKRIHYSDMVLGSSNSYGELSDKKAYAKLLKWIG